MSSSSSSLKHLTLLEQCYNYLDTSKDIPINCFHNFILELISITGKMGSIFERASTDIEKKLSIIFSNQKMFPQQIGLFGFISVQIKHNIHKLSGKGGHKVAPKFSQYISTARTTMRLLWFLEFIQYILERASDSKYKSHLELVEEAYSKTLGKHHGWLTRNIAKLTIGSATNNPYFLMEGISGTTNQVVFRQVLERMASLLKIMIKKSWSFYQSCGITMIE